MRRQAGNEKRIRRRSQLFHEQIPLASLIQTLVFRHAAGVFGIMQSTVSRRITLLQEDLVILLFERSTQGVRLTEAGCQFVARKSAAIDELDHAV